MSPVWNRGDRRGTPWIAARCLFLSLVTVILTAHLIATASAQQDPASEPHRVYSNLFLPCSADAPCSRTESFKIDPVPDGCCTLTVVNGDGNGTDEVRMYEVFLNGARVIPVHRSGNAQARIHLLRNNTLKVNLTGRTLSKLRVQIEYGPPSK